MDPALANALKRKKELERELKDIEQFLRAYKRFAGRDSGRVKSSEDTQPVNEAAGANFAQLVPFRFSVPASPTKRRGRPGDFASIVEGILRQEGRPMTRGELATAVEAAGHTIPSVDKARYLGTILWRHDRKFENIENRGYWLRGEKIPEGFDDLLKLRKTYIE